MKERKNNSCCQEEDIANLFIYSATHRCSLESTSNRLLGSPNADTIFSNLDSSVPVYKLQGLINRALGKHFPKNKESDFYKAKFNLAVDLRDIPFYGKVKKGDALFGYVHRSKAKLGTHQFLRYLIVSITGKKSREILAFVFCRKSRTLLSYLKKALKIVRFWGINIGSLSLDKQFYTVKILNYLKEQGIGFCVPVAQRGRKNSRLHKILKKSNQTQEVPYTMRSGKDKVSFRLVIVHKYLKGRYGKHKEVKYPYAVWGLDWLKPKDVFGFYRHRFAIESDNRSNKSLNIKTCSKRVEVRLLSIAVGFVLMNIWLWVKSTYKVQRHWKRKFTLLLCWALVSLYITSLYKTRDVADFLKL